MKAIYILPQKRMIIKGDGRCGTSTRFDILHVLPRASKTQQASCLLYSWVLLLKSRDFFPNAIMTAWSTCTIFVLLLPAFFRSWHWWQAVLSLHLRRWNTLHTFVYAFRHDPCFCEFQLLTLPRQRRHVNGSIFKKQWNSLQTKR